MKRLGFLAVLVAAFGATAATVDSVTIKQLWPVSAAVRVTYKLSGVSAATDIGVAILNDNVEVPLAGIDKSKLFKGELYGITANGTHEFLIDVTQLKGVLPSYVSNLKVKLTPSAAPANYNEAIYKLINLDDGKITNLTRSDIKNGQYGTWTDDIERDFALTNAVDDMLVWTGVAADERYMKDYLVLRKIPASNGVFRMGGQDGEKVQSTKREATYQVKLSKDYWMGVFEVTQYQYEKVMGTNPSIWTNAADSAIHPVDNVHWQAARGGTLSNWSAEKDWATIRKVDDGSFIANLRALNATALGLLDLPTDAQWEVAARGGVLATCHDGYLNTDDSSTKLAEHLSKCAVYQDNCGTTTNPDKSVTTNGTMRVGSFAPNGFGLYDTVGNVSEWTGDVFMENPSTQKIAAGGGDLGPQPYLDPVGGLYNNYEPYNRAEYNGDPGYDRNYLRSCYRGGNYLSRARESTLSIRIMIGRGSSNPYFGFRLCLTEE